MNLWKDLAPYRMHLCVTPEEILVIKTTGRTTGLPPLKDCPVKYTVSH